MSRQFNEVHWPKNSAVTIVKGNGKGKIAVFLDPMCHFCQKLARETLSQMTNITINAYLWPFLGEQSVEYAVSILSSEDPAKALTDWMVKEIAPSAAPKEDAKRLVADNIALADNLGLKGTPAIFLADGRGPFGAIDAHTLTQKLFSEAK